MQTITHDHSLVRRLVELGQITEDEAAVHPNRNILYRALGQAEPFKPDIQSFPMPHPGYMLICSDGLSGVVPPLPGEPLFSSTPSELFSALAVVLPESSAGLRVLTSHSIRL